MPKYVVKLACGCLDRHAHTDGFVWCPKHSGWRPVIGYYSQEWRARCVTPGCRAGAWLGQSRTTAEAWANNHARSRPGHEIAVKYDHVGSPSSLALLAQYVIGSEQPLPITVSSKPKPIVEDYGPPPF